jgi:hypothetical protein
MPPKADSRRTSLEVRFVPKSEVGLASAARIECPDSIDTSGGSVSADATFALESTTRS